MASFKRVVGVAGQVLRYEDRGQTTEIRDHDVHCFLDLQPLPFHLLPFLIAHCVVLGLCRILASYETRRGVTKFLESRCVAGPGTRNAVSSWAGKFPIPAASAHRNGPQVQASTVHHRCISISASMSPASMRRCPQRRCDGPTSTSPAWARQPRIDIASPDMEDASAKNLSKLQRQAQQFINDKALVIADIATTSAFSSVTLLM